MGEGGIGDVRFGEDGVEEGAVARGVGALYDCRLF